MSDSPREYGREYETPISNRARKRLGYNRTRDELTRFVVQLEYKIDDEWHSVVRYDHDTGGEFGHDVSEEGVHIDIYRSGEKCEVPRARWRGASVFTLSTRNRTEYVAPPMPAKRALDRAEGHLSNNLKGFIRRFEEWHEIKCDR